MTSIAETTVVSVKVAQLRKRGLKNFAEWAESKNHVYIGRNMDFYVKGARKSVWANPFSVKKYGREGCLREYERYIRGSPELMARLEELRGKELGCWCKPEECHGDVLVRLLNGN